MCTQFSISINTSWDAKSTYAHPVPSTHTHTSNRPLHCLVWWKVDIHVHVWYELQGQLTSQVDWSSRGQANEPLMGRLSFLPTEHFGSVGVNENTSLSQTTANKQFQLSDNHRTLKRKISIFKTNLSKGILNFHKYHRFYSTHMLCKNDLNSRINSCVLKLVVTRHLVWWRFW